MLRQGKRVKIAVGGERKKKEPKVDSDGVSTPQTGFEK